MINLEIQEILYTKWKFRQLCTIEIGFCVLWFQLAPTSSETRSKLLFAFNVLCNHNLCVHRLSDRRRSNGSGRLMLLLNSLCLLAMLILILCNANDDKPQWIEDIEVFHEHPIKLAKTFHVRFLFKKMFLNFRKLSEISHEILKIKDFI